MEEIAMSRNVETRDIRCWWFGINNDDKGHMRYENVRTTLERGEELKWPVGGNKATQRHYQEMAPFDSVILWMGNGPLTEDWGVLGFGSIVRVTGQAGTPAADLVIRCECALDRPLRDPVVLKDVFGTQFRPLVKLFGTGTSMDTVYPVTSEQYQHLRWQCSRRAA